MFTLIFAKSAAINTPNDFAVCFYLHNSHCEPPASCVRSDTLPMNEKTWAAKESRRNIILLMFTHAWMERCASEKVNDSQVLGCITARATGISRNPFSMIDGIEESTRIEPRSINLLMLVWSTSRTLPPIDNFFSVRLKHRLAFIQRLLMLVCCAVLESFSLESFFLAFFVFMFSRCEKRNERGKNPSQLIVWLRASRSRSRLGRTVISAKSSVETFGNLSHNYLAIELRETTESNPL